MELTKTTHKKRAAFREKYRGPLFNSYFNTFLVLLVFAFSLYVSGIRISWDLRTLFLIPIAFLYAEAAFYVAHRFQQHRKIRFQNQAYQMHTVWHHGMFNSENMHIESLNDMNMVILPFFVHGFVIGIIYIPIAIIAQGYLGTDVGWIWVFAITLQLIWYEIVHTLSHMENPPFLTKLTSHHREHHNPNFMGKINFGIGTTLFDRLFRTRLYSR